jgi:hypothetical protein
MRLPRVRITVRRLMVAVALAVLASGLFFQQDRQARREAELKKQLHLAKALSDGHEGMRAFLGDLGILIARNATEAEELSVTGQYQPLSEGAPPGSMRGFYPVTPSGKILDATSTRRLKGELLDPHNYMYLGMFDLPEPEFGVRLKRGKESLDVLFSLSSGHLDVWTFLRDDRGEIIQGNNGWLCFPGVALAWIIQA